VQEFIWGELEKQIPIKKALRMVVFGVLAFAIGFLLDWFIFREVKELVFAKAVLPLTH
jgi:hypothetical protein